MLTAMVLAIIVTIAALLRIWRSGRFSRRWLWTIGTIFGLATLRLNWTTGALEFQPVSFLLFSVSAFKTPAYAPWVLSVAIPVVALIALFLYRDAPDDGASAEADAV